MFINQKRETDYTFQSSYALSLLESLGGTVDRETGARNRASIFRTRMGADDTKDKKELNSHHLDGSTGSNMVQSQAQSQGETYTHSYTQEQEQGGAFVHEKKNPSHRLNGALQFLFPPDPIKPPTVYASDGAYAVGGDQNSAYGSASPRVSILPDGTTRSRLNTSDSDCYSIESDKGEGVSVFREVGPEDSVLNDGPLNLNLNSNLNAEEEKRAGAALGVDLGTIQLNFNDSHATRPVGTEGGGGMILNEPHSPFPSSSYPPSSSSPSPFSFPSSPSLLPREYAVEDLRAYRLSNGISTVQWEEILSVNEARELFLQELDEHRWMQL